MDLLQQVRTHWRPKANEMAKGYFPTFPKDIQTILKIVCGNNNFGYNCSNRNKELHTLSIFDPCAGEGDFLNAVTRYLKKDLASKGDNHFPYSIDAYAVELDKDRFEKIKGTHQKINASYFDVQVAGKFNVVLLNPPYNRNGGELVEWVNRTAGKVAHNGIMVLIIPEQELIQPDMQKVLNGNFTFSYAFLSEEYAKFHQVVVFLTNSSNNTTSKAINNWNPTSNIVPEAVRTTFSEHCQGNHDIVIQNYRLSGLKNVHKPLLKAKDLVSVYEECEDRLAKATSTILGATYPSNYDTNLQPVSTLRTAQAIQLAAMNSQIESVTINGKFFLAKYMVVQNVERFEDPGEGTETIVHKPSVEAFLMDESGKVVKAKDLGFDYFELNEQLSGAVLQQLTMRYKPLHEVGQDEDFLADELKNIGLKAPQREAVKALVKLYETGQRGGILRGSTGSGKTWIAKAMKYLTNSQRTIMVTEPQLVPQVAEEYENEGFAVHIIDSWETLIRLYRERPKGMYIIAYTRLRMHPKYELCISEKKTIVKDENGANEIRHAPICPSCRCEVLEKVRKGDKPKCAYCGNTLYTYVSENRRATGGFRNWIKHIEGNGTAPESKTHNKQQPYIKYLKKIKFDLAIIDEAHNAANIISNQGTAFIRLACTAKKVLAMTATITNGMAKSIYNILWGVNPGLMRQNGWDLKSSTEFQARFGAYKEVRKTDQKNRHRASERVTTSDTAGISPAVLLYTLPNVVNVDSDDFDDLPPVERKVVKCQPHLLVDECIQEIDNIIQEAKLGSDDRLAVFSTRNAAYLRVSDTFRHADDTLCLRGNILGTLKQRLIPELLEKEEKLIEIAKGCIDRGERLLVYTGNTQHIDIRAPLKKILAQYVETPGVVHLDPSSKVERIIKGVEVLPDSVAPEKIVNWFKDCTAQIVIASFHRVATGLNLSQFNNLVWFDYTSNTRLAEQGEGRIRRVNTADIHRAVFGHVRPVSYWYLTSSKVQEMQLAYTLEKRMVAKLAEGEVPDIDPNDCTSGTTSFSALMTKALNEGTFSYRDPSLLLKKMSKNENACVVTENFIRPTLPVPQRPVAIIATPPPVETEQANKSATSSNVVTMPQFYTVISVEQGKEIQIKIDLEEYNKMLAAGDLEFTLFGTYIKTTPPKTAKAA